MSWFGKKPTLKEQQRENERALRRANRDIDKDRREIEKEEKKLEMEIKKNAQAGNKEACAVLAKQLIRVRKHKTRTYLMNSKVQGVGTQNRLMGANLKLTEAMSTTAKTMTNINQVMKPEKVLGDMKAFQQASSRIAMTEEMVNDTLDDILSESGDEEESEGIVQQVLDEIGIEISGHMRAAPSALTGGIGTPARGKAMPTDDELEKQLANLRS